MAVDAKRVRRPIPVAFVFRDHYAVGTGSIQLSTWQNTLHMTMIQTSSPRLYLSHDSGVCLDIGRQQLHAPINAAHAQPNLSTGTYLRSPLT